MLSFVTGILTSLSAADAEKTQGRALRQQGNITLANAEHQAAATMRTADSNWSLESDKRKATRRKQTIAVASARNRSAVSGLTSQGTGSALEVATSAEYDQILDNLNKSASITYANYFNNAIATRTQGILQKQAAYAEAKQHDLAAKAIRQSTFVSAAIGAGAGIYGFFSGAQDAEDTTTSFLRASYYAGEIYNNFLGFNPATVSLTRKNNWGAYTAIAMGNTPGFNQSEYSL